MKSALTLARWLGPWADAKRAPVVAFEDHDLDGMRVRLYRPRRSGGRTFLIAQGLHYAGADDPRLDRFCRILARSGHLVIAPYIPDYLALTPNDNAKRDFARALVALPRWTTEKPTIFSISFGSLLAFAAAAEHPELVDRMIIFGGYADFREMMRFCLTGEIEGGRKGLRDPLNQPVVLLNLMHLIECADRPALIEGWRQFVYATWGRPELKVGTEFVAIAERLAPSLPESVRELFLIGVGARPGAAALGLEALSRFDDRQLNPSRYLPRVRCRVDLFHGIDDDVVPFEHSHALGKALSSADARVHITGLYGHSGASKPGMTTMATELATMLRMLFALS